MAFQITHATHWLRACGVWSCMCLTSAIVAGSLNDLLAMYLLMWGSKSLCDGASRTMRWNARTPVRCAISFKKPASQANCSSWPPTMLKIVMLWVSQRRRRATIRFGALLPDAKRHDEIEVTCTIIAARQSKVDRLAYLHGALSRQRRFARQQERIRWDWSS